MKQSDFINFMNVVNALQQQFVESVNAHYVAGEVVVETIDETIQCDPLNYAYGSIIYRKAIMKNAADEKKTLCINVDALNAQDQKVFLHAPWGALENAILTFDLQYKNGAWYYFPPIDIERELNEGLHTVSTQEVLGPQKIERIIHAALFEE